MHFLQSGEHLQHNSFCSTDSVLVDCFFELSACSSKSYTHQYSTLCLDALKPNGSTSDCKHLKSQ